MVTICAIYLNHFKICLNILEYMSLSPNDMFIWMPKEHMCVLVYLVTVLHSMQSGYMEKAQKYTEKALMQIDKLKGITENVFES